MHRDSDGWIAAYKEKGALWFHGGDPTKPHALMTSGKHSSMFFYSKPVVDDVNLRVEASLDLVDLLLHTGFDLSKVDRVVGPQTGATLLAEAISKAIEMRRGAKCKWASPAKGKDGEQKIMVWDDPSQKVLPGERVLLCEDVTTTGGSVLLAKDAVLQAGGIPHARVLTLVNRSGGERDWRGS